MLEASRTWSKKATEGHSKFKLSQELYKENRYKDLSELQVRKILHSTGFKTFPRPAGIPSTWKVTISKQHGGMIYRPFSNEHIEIRVMDGRANAEWPSQRRPYVIHKVGEGWLDKEGNIYKKITHEQTHIPLEEYDFNKLLQKVPSSEKKHFWESRRFPLIDGLIDMIRLIGDLSDKTHLD